MHAGVTHSTRTVAVLSAAYTRSVYGSAEWQAAWQSDPAGAQRKLLVVRVEKCDRPGLLGQVVSFDLFGLSQEAARTDLVKFTGLAISGVRDKPATQPVFPPDAPPGTGGARSAANPGTSGPPAAPPQGEIQIGTVSAPGGQAAGVNYGQMTQHRGDSAP